ncbi:hypothetical protein ACSBR2_035455 [Camellia fascicularis]
MEEKEAFDGEAMLQAQAEIWKYMYHFADSVALKSAVELRIADIIHSHGSPITLSQIAAGIIDSPSLDITCLARIMRLLVRRKIFSITLQSDEFNKIFNDAMGCTARITMKAIMTGYKDGFCGVGSMVDVGGGTGATMSEIVKVHPHIKGIKFDLPHVIATAPKFGGISYVGGDMFKAIPSADVVFMKRRSNTTT